MKKFHRWFPITLCFIGSLSILYYIFLSVIYGFSNISFSWTFGVIGLLCIPYSIFELVHKKHILSLFPRVLQPILLTFFVIGLSFFCIVQGYIIYVGNQTTSTKNSTVLILGAQLNGNQITRSLRYRLDSAVQFIKTRMPYMQISWTNMALRLSPTISIWRELPISLSKLVLQRYIPTLQKPILR